MGKTTINLSDRDKENLKKIHDDILELEGYDLNNTQIIKKLITDEAYYCKPKQQIDLQ